MIHAAMVTDDQLDRMKQVGLKPSLFAGHNHLWGDFHRDILLGSARAQRINPARPQTPPTRSERRVSAATSHLLD